jgi:predicted DNA-binding transcriptional regulator YafY
MRKNTGKITATTFTVDPEILKLAGQDAAELAKPYVWPTAEQALKVVRMLAAQNGHKVVEHEAPGLRVYAIYRYAHRNATAMVLMSVIEISDDTAARLHKAVRREQPVTVTYTKADGTETVRTIEPTSLATTKAGDVIVKAMDRASDAARTFRLDRISAYTVHRTRRTVRTEAPAPAKAELWQQWTTRQNLQGECDDRPAFGILYRRYQDTRFSSLRVQADDVRGAMHALTQHVGNTRYVVLSVRQEVPASA